LLRTIQSWEEAILLSKVGLLTVLLALLALGCNKVKNLQTSNEIRTKVQIESVNSLIDRVDPSNKRLSHDSASIEVKSRGFDFLVGREPSDFLEKSILVDLTDLKEEFRLSVPGLIDWCASHEAETIFKCTGTNLWEIGDKTQPMDLLVLAIDDEKVTDWRLFPIEPY
jgi:hypothetical protein